MLITPTKLAALKDEQITKIMLNQVKVLYPKGDVGKQVAADLGLHEKTFYNWKKSHATPWAVVMLFQEWIAKQRPADPVDPILMASREMAKASGLLAAALQSRADETGE